MVFFIILAIIAIMAIWGFVVYEINDTIRENNQQQHQEIQTSDLLNAWQQANADGTITPAEWAILQQIAGTLQPPTDNGDSIFGIDKNFVIWGAVAVAVLYALGGRRD